MILSRRQNDNDQRDGFTKWPFMTTHSWGEYPKGTWILEVNSYLSLQICNNYIIYYIFITININNKSQ